MKVRVVQSVSDLFLEIDVLWLVSTLNSPYFVLDLTRFIFTSVLKKFFIICLKVYRRRLRIVKLRIRTTKYV